MLRRMADLIQYNSGKKQTKVNVAQLFWFETPKKYKVQSFGDSKNIST